MQRIVSVSAGEPLKVVVDRGGAPVTLTATPQLRELKDNFGNAHRLGVLGISRSMHPGDIKTKNIRIRSRRWPRAPRRPGSSSTGRCPISAACSPAAKPPTSSAGRSASPRYPGEVATAGFVALMHLTAVLSVSIGLLNLFPIPLLDGGHLLFYGIEAARGRPLSERSQEIGFRIGLAIVVMLMIFATFNDILHLATS